MFVNSEPDDQSLDTAQATALLAFADAGPNEPVSLRAIVALSIEAHAREERAARGVSYMHWDDTGESMMYDQAGALAVGDEMEERPPTDWRQSLQ